MGKRKRDESGDAAPGDEAPSRKRRREEPTPDRQPLLDYLHVLAPQLGVAIDPAGDDAMEGVEQDVEDEDAEASESEPESEESSFDEPEVDNETADAIRVEDMDPMVLRSGTRKTDEGPLTSEGLSRRLPPLDLPTAQALFEQAKTFRDLRRKTIDVAQRKPTFYTYMVADTGVEFARFFTATPHTDAVKAMVADEKAANPGFSVEEDTEFSLDPSLQVPKRPSKVSGRTDLYKDHVTTAAQGPHSLAHVLIEEMLQKGLPPEQDADEEPDPARRWARRHELWTAVEEMYLSQVDTPAAFRRLVAGELGGAAASSERIEFAVQRHQELFNQIEGLLSLHAARRQVVAHLAPTGSAAALEAHLEEDGADIDHAHNVLGELIELAPFGSYAWHDGQGASSAQLGGKGERRDGLDEAMALLRAARGPQQVKEAVDGMAELLVDLFDFEQGQFVDLEAYKAFLATRFELAGAPEHADRLLERVLKSKGAQ